MSLFRRNRGRCIQTWSGLPFYPLDPRPEEFRYDDGVVALSREGRYGNHTREPYSVLTHQTIVSLYVETIALQRGWSAELAWLAAREGLVHDWAEAYGRDMASPIKSHWSMWGYRRMLDRIQDAAFVHFLVEPTRETTALVHEVDVRLRVDEVDALMMDPSMFTSLDGVEGLDVVIPDAMTPERSIEDFCIRFNQLFPEYLKVAE